MKASIIYLILFISLSCSASAQQKAPDHPCDLFGPLHFVNGKATVVIKATFTDLFRSNEDFSYQELAQKKRLKFYDYFTRYPESVDGSELAFTTENDSKTHYATLRKNIRFNVNHMKMGKKYYLTCLVFKDEPGYKYVPSCFFAITDISPKKP
ncbi:MAG TPA: hypothetical protein VL490_09805 [Mucilaginibacter sp.]|jgi:hypothetical protein|nr:hypothetical protein [Mucilaginibacter sp.]